MKLHQILRGSVITLLFFSQLLSKVIITPSMRMRAGDRIGARASLLMSLEMDERQRKALLTRDYRIMEKYGVHKSEPELYRQVRAYLSLTTKTAARLADTAIKDMVRGGAATLDYGKSLIESAATYSDRIDIPGRASVSQRRIESLESFLKDDSTQTPAKAAHIQRVLEVHKKVDAIIRRDETMTDFLEQFVAHLSAQYETATTGIQDELSFQMFDLLLTAQPDDDRTLRQVLGARSFLDRFEQRYGSKTWNLFPQDDLERPYFEWVEIIATADKTKSYLASHLLLLASFGMERIKQNVKNQAVWAQSQHALVEKTAEAAGVLEGIGVDLDASMVMRPGYIAKQCSLHFKDAPELGSLHAEIQALMTAYDVMVRSQADVRAVSYLEKDRAQLSLDDQELIADDIPEVEIVAPEDDFILESSKNSSILLKWLPPVIALGIGVAWHVLGKKAHAKSQAGERLNVFWSFFDSVGTPVEFARDRLHEVTARWKQYTLSKGWNRGAGRVHSSHATSGGGKKPHTPPVSLISTPPQPPQAAKPAPQPVKAEPQVVPAPVPVHVDKPVKPSPKDRLKAIFQRKGVAERIRKIAPVTPDASPHAPSVLTHGPVKPVEQPLSPAPPSSEAEKPELVDDEFADDPFDGPTPSPAPVARPVKPAPAPVKPSVRPAPGRAYVRRRDMFDKIQGMKAANAAVRQSRGRVTRGVARAPYMTEFAARQQRVRV